MSPSLVLFQPVCLTHIIPLCSDGVGAVEVHVKFQEDTIFDWISRVRRHVFSVQNAGYRSTLSSQSSPLLLHSCMSSDSLRSSPSLTFAGAALLADRRFLASNLSDRDDVKQQCEFVVVVEDAHLPKSFIRRCQHEGIVDFDQDSRAPMFCLSYMMYGEEKPVVTKLVRATSTGRLDIGHCGSFVRARDANFVRFLRDNYLVMHVLAVWPSSSDSSLETERFALHTSS